MNIDISENNELISVIIPTYNRGEKITAAVNSVLNQTYRNIELIIVDDGSTDNTESVIKSMGDNRIRYVYQKNAGACAARNQGIQLASGDYIAFHDSDDLWYPEKLEKQIKTLKNTGADVVFCKMKHFINGVYTDVIPVGITGGFVMPITLLFGIGTQTLFAKADIFKKTLFDIEMPKYQDFELLVRIAEKYTLYCMDEILVDYFVGEDSISSNPGKTIDACILLAKKHPDFKKKYPVMAKIIKDDLVKMRETFINERDFSGYKKVCYAGTGFGTKRIKAFYLVSIFYINYIIFKKA